MSGYQSYSCGVVVLFIGTFGNCSEWCDCQEEVISIMSHNWDVTQNHSDSTSLVNTCFLVFFNKAIYSKSELLCLYEFKSVTNSHSICFVGIKIIFECERE